MIGPVYLANALVNETIRAVCGVGFSFPGGETDRNLTCRSNGKWDPDPAVETCTPITCYDPGFVSNATRNLVGGDSSSMPTEFVYQQQIEYICQQGYWLSPGTISVRRLFE